MSSPIDNATTLDAIIKALRNGIAARDVAREFHTTLFTLQSRAASNPALKSALEIATIVADKNPAEIPGDVEEPGGPYEPPHFLKRAREEAASLAPGRLGYVMWVERKSFDYGNGKLDPWWLEHLGKFYASGKRFDLGRGGLRSAKSRTMCFALAAEVLLIPRKIEPSQIGVCPIMSSNMREAGGRFDTLKVLLRSCGFRDLTGTRKEDPGGFMPSGGGNQAHIIRVKDFDGHDCEFRCYPATEAGAAGFTGIAGALDEVDLWGKAEGANPAAKVIEVIGTRYTTQPEACCHIWSATYDRESEHARLVALGDTIRQRLARLGAMGSAKDYAERLSLASALRCHHPLLIAPPLPEECTDIPCWVTNPTTPIRTCYELTDGNIERMFALYGGRVGMSVGGVSQQLDGLSDANRRLMDHEPVQLKRFDGLPSWDPRSTRSENAQPKRWRGL